MLETGYQAYTRPTDDPERVAGSVGVPQRAIWGCGWSTPRVAKSRRGAEGDICCDGPSVHLGYHHIRLPTPKLSCPTAGSAAATSA